MTRTRDEALHDKVAEVKRSEDAGEVADSLTVRMELIARMDRGEMTLEEVQAELARIRRGAQRAGKATRAQAWRRG